MTLEHALNSCITTSEDTNHQYGDCRNGEDKGDDKGEKEGENETLQEKKEKGETALEGKGPTTDYKLGRNLAFENTFDDYVKCDEKEHLSTSSLYSQLN
jgi:hypothetical protein